MKKLNRELIKFAAATTTKVAKAAASSACIWYGYQPTEPKSLQEK